MLFTERESTKVSERKEKFELLLRILNSQCINIAYCFMLNSHLRLAFVLMLRPFSPVIVMFSDFPRYFYSAFRKVHMSGPSYDREQNQLRTLSPNLTSSFLITRFTSASTPEVPMEHVTVRQNSFFSILCQPIMFLQFLFILNSIIQNKS